MDSRYVIVTLYALGATAVLVALRRAKLRLYLSWPKHPSLSGHPRMPRRIAALVPFYEFRDGEFFRSDGAPDAIAGRRRAGFMRLAQLYQDRFARTRQLTGKVRE